MRVLFKLIVVLVLLAIVGLVAAVVMSFEDAPLVTETRPLTAAEVARAKRLLKDNDPRKLEDGQVGRVTLSEGDIGLAASHAIGLISEGGAQVQVDDGTLALAATVVVPDNPLGRYVNVEAIVMEAAGLPRFVKLRIGRLAIPGALANFALARAIQGLYADARDVSEVIDEVRFFPGRMRVAYRWHEDAIGRLRARLVPQVDQERVRAYNDQLVRIARSVGERPGLDELLGPLLAHAADRSRSGDPIAENRAVLLVLEAYVNGHGLGAVVPEAREWPSPRKVTPRIQGRKDFPQHFMTSALLAATAGGALSDAVGIYKEIEDSQGGSGFSFTDIIADRAGTRFGELCVKSDRSARRVQEAGARGLSDDQLMPPALDLPEHMNAAEFRSRYGGTDDPRYRRVADEIERRIDALDLFNP